MLRETLARGQIERKTAQVTKVVHHALQHHLEQLILRAPIPYIDIYSADTARAHGENRAAPRIVVLRFFGLNDVLVALVHEIILVIFALLSPQKSVLEVPDKQLRLSFLLHFLGVIVLPERGCLDTLTSLLDPSDYRYGSLDELLGVLFKLLVTLVCVQLGARPVASNVVQQVKSDHCEHFIHRVLVNHTVFLMHILDSFLDTLNCPKLCVKKLLLASA